MTLIIALLLLDSMDALTPMSATCAAIAWVLHVLWHKL